MKIIVDHRERDETLLAILKNEGGLEIEFRQLRVGDYRLPNLLVERKTYIDFFESLKDGRLFRQATNLARSGLQPLLIVEAPINSNYRNPIHAKPILGALITISILYGIPIIKSRNSSESARIILQVNQQMASYGATERRWKRPRPAKNAKSEKRKLQLYFLQGFPGIGPGRAIQLLNQFGSIRNIINLNADQLRLVPGIGSKRIKTIQELLS